MEVRFAARDCVCRGCNVELKRDKDKGFFHYSRCNKGMHIIFCKECCDKIYDLWKVDTDK